MYKYIINNKPYNPTQFLYFVYFAALCSKFKKRFLASMQLAALDCLAGCL